MNTHTKTIAKEKTRENNLWLMLIAIVFLTLLTSSNAFANDLLSGGANKSLEIAKATFASAAKIAGVVAFILVLVRQIAAGMAVIGIILLSGAILYGNDIVVSIGTAFGGG